MKTRSLTSCLAALASAVTLSACMVAGPGGTGFGLGQPSTPSFTVTTHTGSTEMITTTFAPGVGQPGSTRVCLNNQRPGIRSIDLHVTGVNPLATAGRNQQSCASMASTTVANLSAAAGAGPASITPSTLDLSPYDGGLLTLIWR